MIIKSIVELLSTPGALKSFLSWKLFSLSSYKIIKRLSNHGIKPKTVIDVGANIGQFTIASYHEFKCSTIIPIEPDHLVARRLKKNLPPGLSEKIICSAIGDYDGEINFQINADPQNNSVLPLDEDRRSSFPNNIILRQVSVPISRLDTLLNAKELPKPILLKIDVQGYEEQVILGAINTLNDISWIVMEVSFARLYKGEAKFIPMINLMASNGFRFVKPLNFHQSPKSMDIIEMDALFERLDGDSASQ